MSEQPGGAGQDGMTGQPDGTGQDGPAAEVSPLERRYRRLLYAYPRRYRSSRGDELVGTYLDLAEPDRRRPSRHDVVDVLRAGLRQRLREQGASGLAAGLPIAATIAMSTLAAIAAFLLIQVEFTNLPADVLPAKVGPAQTLGAFLWAGWLLAALATMVLPAHWARRGVAAAILLTLAVIPAAPLSGLPRPPLYVLVPVLAFGLMTLALPARPGWAGRIPPLLGALTGTAVGVLFEVTGSGGWFTSYNSTIEILAMAGVLLVGLALAFGLVRAVTGDSGALWSVVLLVTPAGLLGIQPIAGWYWGGALTWLELAATAAVLPLVGTVLLLAVVAWHGGRYRAIRARSAGDPCPTCGHVSGLARRADAEEGRAMP
ncbi:GlsB/YeaQ/YmgE family stress response membrane protein [Plantactinospora sp. B6F1]|uniref:GlsB/YeaQ/YmgE family stress response membrane protein n=1 Tax=Plantactinospora sp. B6F1 TaxID=3158971 RepID=UPI0032D975FD